MIVWFLLGVIAVTSSIFLESKWINLLIGTGSFIMYFDVFNKPIFTFIIFMIGLIFLIIELYIPDLGVLGVVGFVTVTIGLYLHLDNINELLLLIIYSIVLIIGIVVGGFKMGYNLKLSPQFILKTQLNNEEGYSSTQTNHLLLHQKGVVLEDLRPVGKIRMIELDETYQVISQHGYISKGETVTVFDIKSGQIYVRKDNF